MKKLIFLLLAFVIPAMAQQTRRNVPMKDSSSAYSTVLRSGKLTASDTDNFYSLGGAWGSVPTFKFVHTLGSYTVPTGASVVVFDTMLAASKVDTIFLDSISHYTNGTGEVRISDISGINTDSLYVVPAGSDLINFGSGAVLAIKGATATFARYWLIADPLKKTWIKLP